MTYYDVAEDERDERFDEACRRRGEFVLCF